MDYFLIKGEEKEQIKVSLNEVYGFPDTTSPFGGYDVRWIVEITSGNYYTTGELWYTTGEISLFYEGLLKAYKNCSGILQYITYETNLEISLEFIKLGKLEVKGRYKERFDKDNELIFCFETNQSYLIETIEQLQQIHNKYGGMRGINK
ncbi:hypothetical protein E0485_05495 [Paenibacillus albiflavus]|uniref:Uncharacterized protein n=1 Tax=Paenibacillus albiflavus TaxID=2545760 RepID=A0A4R4EHJ6_9BACL|nr:hypothetical protein [Paenibacillus albiflavus]TCZ79319.1 hypothetical protein E0485_05495 [Paenibacillus albiflavus]